MPWHYSRHLSEVVDLPEEFLPFVSDYEMKNLFEVAFLEPGQVQMFQSDFRYVADYFVQKRLNDDYRPTPGVVEHVDAVLKLMTVLTGDRRFEESAGNSSIRRTSQLLPSRNFTRNFPPSSTSISSSVRRVSRVISCTDARYSVSFFVCFALICSSAVPLSI